jgi:hypothetical protein
MTPEWFFQFLWYGAGIGGTGAVWYFLSQRQFHVALWVGFGTSVVVCLAITLHIRNDILKREALAEPSLTPTAPADSSPHSGQPNPSAAEIAAAVAARLPTSTPERAYQGPLPPFSLGGSLKEDDFRDVFLTFRDWKPVTNAQDVTIDWHSIGGADLVVDAVVKGKHGVCYIGVWDVDNDVVVSESKPIDVAMSGVNVTLPIPREAGRKTYRLVTRGPENGSTALLRNPADRDRGIQSNVITVSSPS